MIAIALLISSDDRLAQAVQTAASAVPACHVVRASCLAGAQRFLSSANLSVVIVHLTDTEDRQEIFGAIRAENARRYEVLAIADDYSADQAVEVMDRGAVEYMGRPVDIRRLGLLMDILSHRRRNQSGGKRKPAEGAKPASGCAGDFIVDSSSMIHLMDHVDAVAPLDTTILVTGETGTGKTRLARLIHEKSPRAARPFVAINCGALTTTLIESEIFGHIKGAFSGAENDHHGKFAAADNGTLVLDEIDSLPLTTQGKLLQALDERRYEPVGSTEPRELSARLIIATNQDLRREAAQGRFRPDLLYRIDVVSLHLPPLRERPGLIEPLVEQTAAEFGKKHRGRSLTVSSAAREVLKSFQWPGNIRQLRNVIERAVALCGDSAIDVKHLPMELREGHSDEPQPAPLVPPTDSKWFRSKAQGEVNAIRSALSKHDNNRLQAAKDLGISRVTLYKKMRKYKLL